MQTSKTDNNKPSVAQAHASTNAIDRSSRAMRFEGGVFQWDHQLYREGDRFEKRITWSQVNEDGSLSAVTDPAVHIRLSAEWQRLYRVALRARLLASTGVDGRAAITARSTFGLAR